MSVMAITRAAWQGEFGFRLPWLALLPLLLIPVLGTEPGSLNNLLFATEILLLAAGVRRAIWIPAALLMNELSAANFIHDFGGFQISNRLLLTAVSLPIVLPHLSTRMDFGRRARAIIFVALAFVGLTTGVGLAFSSDAYVLQFLRFIISGLYILMLLPLCVRDRDDLRDLCVLVLGIAALSGLAAVFQHWSVSRGTPVWETVPHPGAPGESFTSWGERALGFNENPVYIGNSLMVAGLFALGVVLIAPLSSNVKRAIAVSLIVMCAAAYFSYTRSWAIAMAPALISIALLYRGKYKKEFWLLVVLLAVGIWYWSDMRTNRYSAAADDNGSAQARPVLWSVGMNIAIDNPWLGVGHDQFLKLSPEYSRTIPTDLAATDEAKAVIGVYTPHNDLLNIWLSWGFFALVLYVLFSILIGKAFIDTFLASPDPFLRGLAIGGFGALIGFQVNSLFHNFFDSTLTIWVLGGFALVLLKLGPYAPQPPPVPPKYTLARNERGEWEQCAV